MVKRQFLGPLMLNQHGYFYKLNRCSYCPFHCMQIPMFIIAVFGLCFTVYPSVLKIKMLDQL